MVAAYEDAHEELEDKHTPGQPWLELKCQELEDGKLKAESLKQMISAEEATDDSTPTLRFKQDGSLGWSKSPISEVPPPHYVRAASLQV